LSAGCHQVGSHKNRLTLSRLSNGSDGTRFERRPCFLSFKAILNRPECHLIGIVLARINACTFFVFYVVGQLCPKTSHGMPGYGKHGKPRRRLSTLSTPLWKSLRGFPHSHGYGDDYHVSEDPQSSPETRNQSHSRRKGLVNHVPGPKRKGCPVHSFLSHVKGCL